MIASLVLGSLAGLALAGLRLSLLRREVAWLTSAGPGRLAPIAMVAATIAAYLLPLIVIGALVPMLSAEVAVAALVAYVAGRTVLLFVNVLRWRQSER